MIDPRYVPFYDVNMSKIREDGIYRETILPLEDENQLRLNIGANKLPIDTYNLKEDQFFKEI